METYVTINAKGLANLELWLGAVLKSPGNAKAWADQIDTDFDGSYQNQIEIGGFHTASGNPEIYRFDDDELDEREVDD